MGVMSARSLRESLKKAQNVGIVEERVQLFDDCEVVVRNLRPDEYEAIHAELKELDEIAYLNGFQRGHVKRAIVELNGQDLRDVQFVDEDEEDPKRPGQMKTVKLELADWLNKNVLFTWSKEAIYIVYRKVEDAVAKAEKRAKEGIEFLTPEETDEDKYRRLIGEVKDLEQNLPQKLVEKVLDEKGYMLKSTAEEVKRAMERMETLREHPLKAAQAAAAAAPQQPVPQPPPVQVAPPVQQPPMRAPVPQPAPQAQQQPAQSVPDPSVLMQGRQPMNQVYDDVPQPLIVSPTPNRNGPIPAGPRSPAPPQEQIHPPIQQSIPGPTLHGSAAVRGAKQAALEMDADQSGAMTAPTTQLLTRVPRGPVIEHKLPPMDPRLIAQNIDPKGREPLNPHFRPPHQQGRKL
jgi:hypothetical protein